MHKPDRLSTKLVNTGMLRCHIGKVVTSGQFWITVWLLPYSLKYHVIDFLDNWFVLYNTVHTRSLPFAFFNAMLRFPVQISISRIIILISYFHRQFPAWTLGGGGGYNPKETFRPMTVTLTGSGQNWCQNTALVPKAERTRSWFFFPF